MKLFKNSNKKESNEKSNVYNKDRIYAIIQTCDLSDSTKKIIGDINFISNSYKDIIKILEDLYGYGETSQLLIKLDTENKLTEFTKCLDEIVKYTMEDYSKGRSYIID